MSWGVSPWVYPVWDSMGFLDLSGYFLPHFREVFNHYVSKYFLMPFLVFFFFWDTYNSNVGIFNIVPEVSEVVLICFIYFLFLFFSLFHLFPPFYLPSHLSYYLCHLFYLLVPSRGLLISVITLFIIDWLFSISPRSLLNISCIFSILVSSLFICNSILLSFWIIFTIIILNFFFRQTPYFLLFCLILWTFIMFLYFLYISLPFPFV